MDKISKPRTRPIVSTETWTKECIKLQRIFEENTTIDELKIILPFVYVKTTQQCKQGKHGNGEWITHEYIKLGHIIIFDFITSAKLVFKRSDISFIYFEIVLPNLYNYQPPEEISPLLNMLYVDPRDDSTILEYRIATTDHLEKRLIEFKNMVDIFYKIHCQPSFSESFSASAFIY